MSKTPKWLDTFYRLIDFLKKTKNTMNTDIQSEPASLRIVVVDDNKMLLQIHAEILKVIGHEPLAFDCPHNAVSYLKQHGKNVDIIITDYKMPKMNGLQLIQIVSEYGQHIPSMILTAAPDDLDQAEVARHNIKVLHKPVKIDLLSSQIAAL